jgi:hypothetical protein
VSPTLALTSGFKKAPVLSLWSLRRCLLTNASILVHFVRGSWKKILRVGLELVKREEGGRKGIEKQGKGYLEQGACGVRCGPGCVQLSGLGLLHYLQNRQVITSKSFNNL